MVDIRKLRSVVEDELEESLGDDHGERYADVDSKEIGFRWREGVVTILVEEDDREIEVELGIRVEVRDVRSVS